MSSTAEVKSLRRELSALKSQVAKIAQATVLLPRLKHKLTSVEVGADVTGGHAGDIALSDLSEKNVDSLTDTDNYKRLTEAKDTKVAGISAGADVTGDHQGDVNIDNIAEGTAYKKYLAAERTKMTGMEAGADVTGDRIVLAASSLLPNWRLDIKDANGRPAGIYPCDYTTIYDQLSWLDGDKAEIKILSTPDTTVGYGFPAIPIDDKQKYTIYIRHKSSAASTDGLYLRFQQYDAALPSDKTHIGLSGGANAQVSTNQANLIAAGAMPGTSWTVDEYTYTPTAGTKYASFVMMNYNPDTAEVEYHVDYVLMYGTMGDSVVDTPQIVDSAVTILTTAQDDSWWYLDPSPMSQTGYGLYRAAVLTAEFTSTGFPCQIDFDTSVDGRNLTFVSKSMHAIFRAVDTYADFSISTITLSGSDLVKITTTAAHGLDTDDFVWLWGIVGTIELNEAICKVTVVSSTEFTLQLTRSDWFTAYTSGGIVRHVDLWGLRYGFLYHEHDTGIHMSLFDDYLDDGKVYQYIGAIRNRNSSQYAYINEGSVIRALEIKK